MESMLEFHREDNDSGDAKYKLCLLSSENLQLANDEDHVQCLVLGGESTNKEELKWEDKTIMRHDWRDNLG